MALLQEEVVAHEQWLREGIVSDGGPLFRSMTALGGAPRAPHLHHIIWCTRRPLFLGSKPLCAPHHHLILSTKGWGVWAGQQRRGNNRRTTGACGAVVHSVDAATCTTTLTCLGDYPSRLAIKFLRLTWRLTEASCLSFARCASATPTIVMTPTTTTTATTAVLEAKARFVSDTWHIGAFHETPSNQAPS